MLILVYVVFQNRVRHSIIVQTISFCCFN